MLGIIALAVLIAIPVMVSRARPMNAERAILDANNRDKAILRAQLGRLGYRQLRAKGYSRLRARELSSSKGRDLYP